MKSADRPTVLIVEPDRQIRKEIFNFLLSDGYEKTEEADSLEAALDKVRQSAYEIVMVDAGASLTVGMQFAADLAGISPNTRIIFMINAEDQQPWDQIATQSDKIRFLIKTDFARNLLYLLEEHSQL